LAILPDDLRDQVHAALVERPELSWDLAVSAVVGVRSQSGIAGARTAGGAPTTALVRNRPVRDLRL
jgi:hypothetical protein